MIVLNTFSLHVERKLLWNFVSRWGKLPACNKE